MTRILTNRSKKSSASLLAVALAATVAFGMGCVVLSAHAEDSQDERRDENHRDARDDHGRPGHGGHYAPPPVVYDLPCVDGNCAPPIIYGPGVGAEHPSTTFNIR